MKLTLDEQVKHRLIGLAVILSIAAIFAPAMIKKSNQRLDENTTLFVKVPPKPTPPQIVMPEEKAMFNRVKVAKVESVKTPTEPTALTLSRAEYLNPSHKELQKNQSVAMQEKKLSTTHPEEDKSDNDIPPNSKPVSNNSNSPELKFQAKSEINPIKVPVSHASYSSSKGENNKSTVLKKTSFNASNLINPSNKAGKIQRKNEAKVSSNYKKESYLVQLASFSKKQNADQLINKLRANGYHATYNAVNTPNGLVYKVVVGQTAQKQQAQVLRKRLAATTQLKGLIVTNIG